MVDNAQETAKTEVTKRLDKIAFHFEQRDTICDELENCSMPNESGNPFADTRIQTLVTRIENEQVQMLYELVHLWDNISKYFKACGLKEGDLQLVDKFKPFRVLSNFVNTHKHGTQGNNRPSAKNDYLVYFRVHREGEPQPLGPITGIDWLTNYDGGLYRCMELAESLIQLWMLFLRYHTTLDIKEFTAAIGKVVARRKDRPLYTASIPEGVLKDAKKTADDRKYLKF